MYKMTLFFQNKQKIQILWMLDENCQILERSVGYGTVLDSDPPLLWNCKMSYF